MLLTTARYAECRGHLPRPRPVCSAGTWGGRSRCWTYGHRDPVLHHQGCIRQRAVPGLPRTCSNCQREAWCWRRCGWSQQRCWHQSECLLGNLYTVAIESCGLSRQVVFNDRENKYAYYEGKSNSYVIHSYKFFWFIFNDWFWRLIPGICKFSAGLSSLILAGCRVNTIEGDLYSPNDRLSWKPMHIEGLIITWNYFFQEAECEKIRMDAKFEADTKIADSSRAYLMQKANFDMEVNAKVGENNIRLYKNRIKPPYNMVIFLSIRLYGNLFIKYILTKDS